MERGRNKPCIATCVRRSICAALLSAVVCNATAFAQASTPPTPLPRPFGRGQATFHRTEFAPYTFESTVIRVRFDVARGIVYGDETAVVHPKHDGLRSLPFDTLGIEYAGVTVDGTPATFTFDAARQRINVHLNAPALAGSRLAVEFKYRTRPQRGVYFIRPDKSYPDVTPEIWTQGEATDNRRWFPTWDEPNQKTPSELIVTVPRAWTVVGNGYLKSHTVVGAYGTWDWNAPRPKSTYLIAFVAGPLSKHHTTLGHLDVDAFVQPPKAGLNALCFGRTNQMTGYFSQLIGVAYPWEKEDQMTAERFTFGGMENSSATIQTDTALHPAVEDVESSCDVLVSHELAQQWFGDDVTMSDWSNGWINEGFATYYHQLWGEHDLGEAAFEYDRYQAQQSYFAETQHYYRPIVDYTYAEAVDLFDVSGHQRPAEILHMLRHMFGDARFYKALRDYLIAYEDKNANTHQFFVAVGKSLGTDLSWFENEWFYRAAYPHYYVSDRYDAVAHTLTFDIEQKNHDGRPFRMPVEIEALVDGVSHVIRPAIDRNEQTVTMTGVPSKPQMVLFDPNNNVLRQLTFDKPLDELAYQLVNAPHTGDRAWALAQLGGLSKSTDPAKKTDAMLAVRHASLSDSFYGIRADAVTFAASFGDAEAIAGALHDKDRRVRISAVKAAGTLAGQPDAVISPLMAMTSDPDPNVVAAAYASLGALKPPGIYEQLVAGLERPSYNQAIAIGALRGLAAYGDVQALPFVRQRTAYGTQEQERNAAIVVLAQLAEHTQAPQAALPPLLDIVQHDPLITSRAAAATALGILGETSAVPELESVERLDPELKVQAAAWNAVLAIRDAAAAKAYNAANAELPAPR
jgi:aminopeptidase N